MSNLTNIEEITQEFYNLGSSLVDQLMEVYYLNRTEAKEAYFFAYRNQPWKGLRNSKINHFYNLGQAYRQKLEEISPELKAQMEEAHQKGYRERLLQQNPGSYFRE